MACTVAVIRCRCAQAKSLHHTLVHGASLRDACNLDLGLNNIYKTRPSSSFQTWLAYPYNFAQLVQLGPTTLLFSSAWKSSSGLAIISIFAVLLASYYKQAERQLHLIPQATKMAPSVSDVQPKGASVPVAKLAQTTPDDKTTEDPRDDNLRRAIATHSFGGAANLRDVFTNQDTGFSYEKRDQLGLRGLLPPAKQSLNTQVLRVLHQLRSKSSPLEKHVMLASLRQTNTRLYYATILANKEEILPLIYTPTVGEACQKFSHIYRRPEGLSISLEDKGKIASIVDNWPVPAGAPRIAVVTDGSRILGLGDLGWNGQGISIGKLSLYVAGAGIHPRATLPIVVDLGTNNKKMLEDPLYLGLRRERASTEEYIEFMDEFMDALHSKYPNLIIQFEDFTSENAFRFLESYQDKYPMFNDDIQGTGSVILAGFTNAARIASKESGRPLHDHRILMAGAGSAAVGVGKQLMSFFTRQGLSEDEARSRIYITDSKGLVTSDRGDKLPEHKVFFARNDNAGRQIKDLAEIVDYVKPTAILGLSTVKGTFDETVIRKMGALNQRPIIFPLSNPTDNSECTFEEAVKFTEGRVLFAAGSPFPEIEAGQSPTGKRMIPGQGNNFLVFPGIGLCAALCKAARVTNEMITESALALSDALNDEERAEGRLYPNTERIREISRDIAVRCIQMANKQGVTRDNGKTAAMDEEQLREWVQGEMWTPVYGSHEDA